MEQRQWRFSGKFILVLCITLRLYVSESQGHATRPQRVQRPSFFYRHFDCIPSLFLKDQRINSTRVSQGTHLDNVTVELSAFGRRFTIDLHLNKKLFVGSYVERVFLRNGSEKAHVNRAAENCYYHGQLRFEPESVAALSTCDGLRGYITDRQDTYHVEPGNGRVHRVYRNKDHRKLPFRCGSEGHDHRLHDHQIMISRHKRSLRAPYDSNKNTRYVELYLVNDYRTFERNGNNSDTVIRRSQNIANIVSSLYRQLNIYVILVGVEVWTVGDRVRITPSADTTMENFLRYRKERINPHYHNDNAQLITGVFFDHGVVGKAIKGPICTHQFSGGVNMDYGGIESVVATTVAHEMGHNFGMEHDNDTMCECRDDRCIMAATSGQISPKHWSTCSQNAIAEAFDLGMDYCLQNLPKTVFEGPVCGNGFKEEGEECDCGLPDDCTNRCCNPHTCRLYARAQCGTGRCCDLRTCRIKAASSLCREPSGECDFSEFCDGFSEYCPADVYRQDGVPCKSGQSYCYQGQCKTHTAQCELLWGDSGRVSDPLCFQQLNMNGNSDGNCGYNWTTEVYKRCDRESVMCGLLHCVHLNEKLMFWRDNLALDMKASFLSRGNKQYVCRSAKLDVGLDMPDPGMVPDGAKCEENKICIKQKCVSVAKLNVKFCPQNCNGHGRCNSRGNCHCDNGYAPPLCDKPGYGGSSDSGPASDEYGRTWTTTTRRPTRGHFQPVTRPTKWPPYRPTQRPPYRPTQRPPYRPTQRPPYRPTQRPPYRPTQRPPYRPTLRPPYRPTKRPHYRPTQRPPYMWPTKGPQFRPTKRPVLTATIVPRTITPNISVSTNATDHKSGSGDDNDLLIALLVLFLLVLPIVVLAGLAYYNRNHLAKWWRMMPSLKYRVRGRSPLTGSTSRKSPQPTPQPRPSSGIIRKKYDPPSQDKPMANPLIHHGTAEKAAAPRIWRSAEKSSEVTPPLRPTAPPSNKSNLRTQGKSSAPKGVRLSIPIQETGGPPSPTTNVKSSSQVVTSASHAQMSGSTSNIPADTNSPKSSNLVKRESFRGSEISEPVLMSTTNRNSLVLAGGQVDIIGPEAKLVSRSPPLTRPHAVTVKRSQSERPVSRPDMSQPNSQVPQPGGGTLRKSASAKTAKSMNTAFGSETPEVEVSASGFRPRPLPPDPTDEDDSQPVYTNESEMGDLLDVITGALKGSNLYSNLPPELHSPVQETVHPVSSSIIPHSDSNPQQTSLSTTSQASKPHFIKPKASNTNFNRKAENDSVQQQTASDNKKKTGINQQTAPCKDIATISVSADKNSNCRPNKPNLTKISYTDGKPDAGKKQDFTNAAKATPSSNGLSEELRKKLQNRSSSSSSSGPVKHIPPVKSDSVLPRLGQTKGSTGQGMKTNNLSSVSKPGSSAQGNVASNSKLSSAGIGKGNIPSGASGPQGNKPSSVAPKPVMSNTVGGKTTAGGRTGLKHSAGRGSGLKNATTGIGGSKLSSEIHGGLKPRPASERKSVSSIAAKFNSPESDIVTSSEPGVEVKQLIGKPLQSSKPAVTDKPVLRTKSVSGAASKPLLPPKPGEQVDDAPVFVRNSSQPKRVQSYRI